MTNTLRTFGLIFMLLLASAPVSHAHTIGQTYLYLNISENTIGVRFEVFVADMNTALGLDLATDGSLQESALLPHSQRMEAYLRERSNIRPAGMPVDLVFKEHTIRTTKTAQYILSHFEIAGLVQAPEYIDINYSVMMEEDPKQDGVLVIENDWKSHTFANEAGVSLIFGNSSREQRLDLTSSTILRGLMAMVNLGMQHILEGIDHVMFLIAILLPAVMRRKNGRWEPLPGFRSALWNVTKIVTMFTLAHSITLSLAALELMTMPPRVVESVIAASIAIAALDIFFPILGKRVVLIVFLFGLFHGAGFASVILSMEIHPDYMVWTLLGFNVGVEVGQLAIVCVVFPILYLLRLRPLYVRYAMPAAATILIAVSSYWFLERAFDLDLPAGEYAQRLLGIDPAA